MSIDAFFNDVLPNIGDLTDRFIAGDDKDLQLEFDNALQIRGDMAIDLQNSSNRGQQVVHQNAYDAASVLERQIAVIGQDRIAYHAAAKVQREQTAKVYQDIRVQGISLRNRMPSTDTAQDDIDEPYLDDDNKLIFDRNE